MPIQPGSRLGPYEVLSAIGAGGMGEVWRARDPRLGRDVAIKVLPASFSADADRLRRFELEARAAGVLNHPNITAVLDIGEDADTGSPYQDQYRLYSAEGGEGRPVSALTPDDIVSRWTSDGRGVLAYRMSEVPGRLERVDLETGRRELVHRLAPPDLAGVVRVYAAVVAADENVYAYNALMRRADLLFVDGAR